MVIGDGPELPKLRKIAPANVHLLGYQPDEDVVDLLSKARGFVCAAEEDFGIAIVEAQAAGCPVITYRQGGALDTVIEGVTGLFFEEQSPVSVIESVRDSKGKLLLFASMPYSTTLKGSAKHVSYRNSKSLWKMGLKEALSWINSSLPIIQDLPSNI